MSKKRVHSDSESDDDGYVEVAGSGQNRGPTRRAPKRQAAVGVTQAVRSVARNEAQSESDDEYEGSKGLREDVSGDEYASKKTGTSTKNNTKRRIDSDDDSDGERSASPSANDESFTKSTQKSKGRIPQSNSAKPRKSLRDEKSTTRAASQEGTLTKKPGLPKRPSQASSTQTAAPALIKKNSSRPTEANLSSSRDLDLTNPATMMSLFKIFIQQSLSKEQQPEIYETLRAEARKTREAEAKTSFDLMAPSEKIRAFESCLEEKRYLPTLNFGEKVAHFTVRSRKAPAVLPSDFNHILLNKKIPAALKTDALSQAGTSGSEIRDEEERMSFRTFIETRVPSLSKPYKPCWWLPTGHVQTAYCVMANFDAVDTVVYKSGLDFTPVTPTRDQDETAPVIVVLHGLSGGSQESYVRSILATACAPQNEGGLGARAVVVNFRGCCGVPLTSPQFYSAGHTDDIRSALLYISAKYPKAPLLGVGFSLGANVLTRYVGEEGVNSRLKAAAVLACPWDIVANSKQLEGRTFNREVYSRAMGGNLIALLKSHLPAIDKMDGSLLKEETPKALALKKPSLKEVDEHMASPYIPISVCIETVLIVRVAGGSSPPFPFPTADAYYAWAGSHLKVPGIRIPFLAVNSIDDPIVAEIPYEACSQNPWVCLVTTEHGGHLGWFEGDLIGREGTPPHRWIKKPVLEWFAAVLDIVDQIGAGSGTDVGNPREVKDGFVVEIDQPFVGYRVIQSGMEITAGTAKLLKGL
ncbi:hypothetical protein FRC00_002148 [Tulasnella sp. 408]|nr:hypothetical protein FRC00_002148 [Tulasnella sp. 408]